MDAFLKTLQTLPEVAELVRRVENGGCPAVLTGTQPVQRACVGAAVAAGAGRPMVFLCADEREARQLAGDLQSLTGETPFFQCLLRFELWTQQHCTVYLHLPNLRQTQRISVIQYRQLHPIGQYQLPLLLHCGIMLLFLLYPPGLCLHKMFYIAQTGLQRKNCKPVR